MHWETEHHWFYYFPLVLLLLSAMLMLVKCAFTLTHEHRYVWQHCGGQVTGVFTVFVCLKDVLLWKRGKDYGLHHWLEPETFQYINVAGSKVSHEGTHMHMKVHPYQLPEELPQREWEVLLSSWCHYSTYLSLETRVYPLKHQPLSETMWCLLKKMAVCWVLRWTERVKPLIYLKKCVFTLKHFCIGICIHMEVLHTAAVAMILFAVYVMHPYITGVALGS